VTDRCLYRLRHAAAAGNFSFPALQCCMLEMGADRIMFSVDYPWSENVEGVAFMESIPVSREDKDKMLHKNVECLLRL
jgi:predicted TIM-barrel fold metal-dependent hydrolase